METDKLLDEIFEISRTKEGKSLQELTLKCSEEVGELAQAVLSFTGACGCTYKKLNKEDVIEELADVFLVNLAMVAKLDITKEEFKAEIERKLNKWVEKVTEKSLDPYGEENWNEENSKIYKPSLKVGNSNPYKAIVRF